MTVHTLSKKGLKEFAQIWIEMLWRAMSATGKGYRYWTLKNQPPEGASRWRGERRADKVGTTKLSRSLLQRMQIA